MAGVAAGLTSVALAAAGCGGHAANVALPRQADTTTVAPVAQAGQAPTPQQAITAAYSGYWRAYAAAMASLKPARAAAILAPYATRSGIPQLIMTLKAVWAAKDTAYGGAVIHVKGVQITGRRAILHDCLDLSHFGVLNRTTGRVVPDSFGLPNRDYYISLVRSGGRWRVSNMEPVEVPCEP
jgi:hypothetical protein